VCGNKKTGLAMKDNQGEAYSWTQGEKGMLAPYYDECRYCKEPE